MHVNIKDIMAQEIGASTNFEITGELPDLADVSLSEPLHGVLRLIRTNSGVLASGQITVNIGLQCHRCLTDFGSSQTPVFDGEFALKPGAEQWPIEADSVIDIGPLIRQETLLSLPIKQLCRPDCPGLCVVCGHLQSPGHKHPESEVKHRPRIVNRSQSQR
jgi:uncharacterized protein